MQKTQELSNWELRIYCLEVSSCLECSVKGEVPLVYIAKRTKHVEYFSRRRVSGSAHSELYARHLVSSIDHFRKAEQRDEMASHFLHQLLARATCYTTQIRTSEKEIMQLKRLIKHTFMYSSSRHHNL